MAERCGVSYAPRCNNVDHARNVHFHGIGLPGNSIPTVRLFPGKLAPFDRDAVSRCQRGSPWSERLDFSRLVRRVATRNQAEESNAGVNEARSTKRYSLADVRSAKITRHVTRENKEALVSSFVPVPPPPPLLLSFTDRPSLRSLHFAPLSISFLPFRSYSSYSISVFWQRAALRNVDLLGFFFETFAFLVILFNTARVVTVGSYACIYQCCCSKWIVILFSREQMKFWVWEMVDSKEATSLFRRTNEW